MKKLKFLTKCFVAFVGSILLCVTWQPQELSAEYLSRSRIDQEVREKIHNILRKTLGDVYINVSVIQHTFLNDQPVKQESELLPGVVITTNKNDIAALLRYRTIVITVNQNVELDQLEKRIRSVITELEAQDRFEQSVMLDKLKMERPDFSANLVEYLNLMVASRKDLIQGNAEQAQEKLKQASAISSEFPPGYEMLGFEQLIPDYQPEGAESITTTQWAIIGTLLVLLLLILILFFFVSRNTREKEEQEHPLQETLGKVATAIESMAPDDEEAEGEIDIAEEINEEQDDQEKIDYYGFIRKMPQKQQIELIKQVQPQYQAMIFSQLESDDVAEILKELPGEDALATIVYLKNVKASSIQYQQLANKLTQLVEKLPIEFDGLSRIGELSGQVSVEQWNSILESSSALQSKNPELAEKASQILEEIRERSLSFEELSTCEEFDLDMLGRVMERFERSRLKDRSRVSVPYILLDTEQSVADKITQDYTEETREYYHEQLKDLREKRENDDEERERIDHLRDLHRSMFMRHVHQELNKIRSKAINETA